jgi:glycosyltransferase involved in cell wall biosynthesis
MMMAVKIIQKMAESLGVKVVSNYKNKGKGYSMRKGVKYCNGDIVVFQDADLEYDPRDIPKLLKPLLIRKNIAVYGSRFKKKTNKITSFYRFGNLLISFLINLFFHSHLSDVETGYEGLRERQIKKHNKYIDDSK